MPIKPSPLNLQRTYCVGHWPDLEAACVQQVRTWQAADPLLPVVLLVGSNPLGRSLVHRVSSTLGGVANVRACTFLDLARRLAEVPLCERRSRPIGAVARKRVVQQLAEQLPRDSYFASVAERQAFHDTLDATLIDLREARWTATALQAALEQVDGRGHQGKLRELVGVLSRYEAVLDERRLYDAAGLMGAAVDAAEASPWLAQQAGVIVYGLYDLNPLQRDVVSAVSAVRPTTLLVPGGAGPAWEYTKPIEAWLRSEGYVLQQRDESANTPHPLLTAADHLFDAAPPAPSSTVPITIISAPGEPREVREAARTILHWVQERGVRFNDIAVLTRNVAAYASLIRDEFPAFGIDYCTFQGPELTTTRPGRQLLGWLQLVSLSVTRTAWFEWLVSLELKSAWFQGRDHAEILAQWEGISVTAGLNGDLESWPSQLEGFERRMQARAQETGAPPDPSGVTSDTLEAVSSLTALLEAVLELRQRWPCHGSAETYIEAWQATVEALCLAPESAAEHNVYAQVVASLDSLRELDTGGEAFTADEWSQLATSCLARTQSTSGQLGRGGVFVGDLMMARGLQFRGVIVLGMVEGLFPAFPRQDPILLDHERAALNELADHRLGLKHERIAEDRCLMALALTAATEQIVLTFPRLELGEGRERIPSFFLIHVAEAMTGQRMSWPRMVERGLVDRVPIAQPFPSEADQAIEATEWRLSVLHRALTARTPEVLSGLYDDSVPTWPQALRAEAQRWGRRQWGAYEGMLDDAEVVRLVAERFDPATAAFSPTRLEEYALCPHRFFHRYVLGLDEVEQEDDLSRLQPWIRGVIMHDVLREYVQLLIEQDKLPWDSTQREDYRSMLHELIQRRLDRAASIWPTGYPLVWQIEREEMTEDLEAWLAEELDGTAEWIPTLVEAPFGISKEAGEGRVDTESVTFHMPSGRSIQFDGRIDRIDVDASGQRLRVVDYKTGRHRGTDDSLAGGRALQLPVYLLGAQSLLPGKALGEAQYRYLRYRGQQAVRRYGSDDWPARSARLGQAVEGIVAGIRAGQFFPVPENHKCRSCVARLNCLGWVNPLTEQKHDDPATTSYRALQEIE